MKSYQNVNVDFAKDLMPSTPSKYDRKIEIKCG